MTVGAGPRSIARCGRWQLAPDYHARRIAAGDDPKSAVQGQFQGAGIAGLDDAVQFALTGGAGDALQDLQQASADAQRAEPGQDHQRKLGPRIRRDIFGVCDHLAIAVHGQHHDPVALIDGGDAAQQGQIGRVAMREVTLIEAFAVHRGEKPGHRLAVIRAGCAQPDIDQAGGPWLARAHNLAPATKSTAAMMTPGSLSTRRCPSPEVASRRERGQLARWRRPSWKGTSLSSRS